MKSLLTTAVAALMLAGILSAATTTPTHPKKSAPALMGDAGPMPICYPTEPGCKPPIPPAQGRR